MKLALAQIDIRLGDLAELSSRITAQVHVAHQQGADLVCFPAPCVDGVNPGRLVFDPAFVSDAIVQLQTIAKDLQDLSVSVVVPMVVPFGDESLFEIFLLKDGMVVPMRSLAATMRTPDSPNQWDPPVADVDGLHVAFTCALSRDASALSAGCDLLVAFQIDPFAPSRPETQGIVGHSSAPTVRAWTACMVPVGAYDEMTYTGGSYVVDDAGAFVAAAPVCEEALLVCEVLPGSSEATFIHPEIPSVNDLTWGALVSFVQDTVSAQGYEHVVVNLDGSFTACLLTVLAADAVGPRNVVAALIDTCPHGRSVSSVESARLQRARMLSARLGVETVSAELPMLSEHRSADDGFDRALDASLLEVALATIARASSAAVLSPLTKFDYAFCGRPRGLAHASLCAPFGDLLPSELLDLANARNTISPIIDEEVLGRDEITRGMRSAMASCLNSMSFDEEELAQAMSLFEGEAIFQTERLLSSLLKSEATASSDSVCALGARRSALVALMVRFGEVGRRRFPMYAVLSSTSFLERSWPCSLAWSQVFEDTVPVCVRDLVAAELERVASPASRADDMARRREMHGIISSAIAEGLGIDPSDMEEFEQGAVSLPMNGDKKIPDPIKRLLGGMLGSGPRPEGLEPGSSLPPTFSLN